VSSLATPRRGAPGRRRDDATAGTGRGPGVSGRDRVGLGFVVLYALAFMASCLMLIAPLLVTLGALGEVVFHAA
jgi:hypothetical protein